jgi:beta-lysine 5,6-aminomutase alpha subunit
MSARGERDGRGERNGRAERGGVASAGARSKLDLDRGVIEDCEQAAATIAAAVGEEIAGKTTVSVERTIARLLGVDGANELEAPLPNVLVDHVRDRSELGRGIAYWLGNAMLGEGARSPQRIAEAVDTGELDLCALPRAPEAAIRERVREECERRVGEISARMERRRELRERLGESPPPLRYVLTATGNVYEDVVHALAVAEAGGDIVAVIRSTAQSLLDYVPYGPTTEGYGGTFATQANFRIMRAALDEWSQSNGRYVRLSSFCSGLCMPEIAVMGAIEGYDNMVNDALYGILYRDINPVRGLIDQRSSRGQLPAHRGRDLGGAVGDGVAVHQPAAGARLGRAGRADRARRRVRDRPTDH